MSWIGILKLDFPTLTGRDQQRPAQNQHKTAKPAETRRDQHKTSTKQRNRQRPAETSTKPAQNSETGRDQQRPAQNQHKTAKPAETSRDQHKTSTKPAETAKTLEVDTRSLEALKALEAAQPSNKFGTRLPDLPIQALEEEASMYGRQSHWEPVQRCFLLAYLLHMHGILGGGVAPPGMFFYVSAQIVTFVCATERCQPLSIARKMICGSPCSALTHLHLRLCFKTLGSDRFDGLLVW